MEKRKLRWWENVIVAALFCLVFPLFVMRFSFRRIRRAVARALAPELMVCDLDFIGTEQLVQELHKRSDAMVCAYRIDDRVVGKWNADAEDWEKLTRMLVMGRGRAFDTE